MSSDLTHGNLLSNRQGVYNEEGDIVVLCAYLGQLSEIRKHLASEVITVMDDRDLSKLAEAEEAGQSEAHAEKPLLSVTVERVQVSRRVYVAILH